MKNQFQNHITYNRKAIWNWNIKFFMTLRLDSLVANLEKGDQKRKIQF